jgi:hypothetical protein
MQRTHQYNNSPRSVTFCSRNFANDQRESFTIVHSDIFTIHTENNLKVQSQNKESIFRVSKKCKDIDRPTHPTKKIFSLEKDESNESKIVQSISHPPKVIYESPLQAFMQQLLAVQNLSVSSNVDDDQLTIRLPPKNKDDTSIPELQESYTSSSDLVTDNEDDDHDDIRDIDRKDSDYDDLPPLIDMAREMRSYM